MQLGYDAKRAFHNHTGLGNYARTLLGYLLQLYPQHQYHLFTPGLGNTDAGGELLRHRQVYVHRPKRQANPNSWRRRGMVADVQEAKVQVYHGLSHELPIGLSGKGVPQVVTMHDTIFMDRPQDYPWIDRQVYKRKVVHASKQADVIIAISQHTKEDLIRHFDIPEEKIRVVYQSYQSIFSLPVSKAYCETLLKKYKLPRNFLLYVGSVVPRKHLLTLIDALALMPKDQRPPLVVVGSGGSYLRQVRSSIRRRKLINDVYFPKGVTNSELVGFYYLSKCLVYPSRYEGFGLPVVEALMCGTPVITGKSSALPEAGGPGALYLEEYTGEALLQLLEILLGNDALQQELAKNGWEYVKRFAPEKVTGDLVEIYRELVP